MYSNDPLRSPTRVSLLRIHVFEAGPSFAKTHRKTTRTTVTIFKKLLIVGAGVDYGKHFEFADRSWLGDKQSMPIFLTQRPVAQM